MKYYIPLILLFIVLGLYITCRKHLEDASGEPFGENPMGYGNLNKNNEK